MHPARLAVAVLPLGLFLAFPLAESSAQLRSGLAAGPEARVATEWNAVAAPRSRAASVAARRSRWVEGMLIGAAAGAAIGAASVLVRCYSTCGDDGWQPWVIPVSLAGGVGGGLLGAVVGAFVRTD